MPIGACACSTDGRVAVIVDGADAVRAAAAGVAQRARSCTGGARDVGIAARLPLALLLHSFHCGADGVYTFLGEFGRVAANLPVDVALRAIGISVVLSSLRAVSLR